MRTYKKKIEKKLKLMIKYNKVHMLKKQAKELKNGIN